MSSPSLQLKVSRGPSLATMTRRVALANTTLTISVWVCLASLLFREVTGSATIAMIGSYNFTTSEPIFAAAVLTAAVTLPVYRIGWGPLTWVLAVFIAIALINLIVGLLINVPAAIISLRGSAVFCIFLVLGRVLYDRDHLLKVFMSAAAPIAGALSLLVLLRLIFGASLFIQTQTFDLIGVNDGDRPLAVFGVLFLGVYLTLLVSQFIGGQRKFRSRHGLLAIAVGLAILFSGQGTASIAAVIGLFIVICFQPGRNHLYRVLAFLMTVLGISTILIAVTFFGGDLVQLLPSSVTENFTRRAGNLKTREHAWAGIMHAYRYSTDWQKVMGWPAGTWPYIVIERGSHGRIEWTVNAHSMYFGILIRLGALGLACLLTLMVTNLLGMIYRVIQSPLANARAVPTIALLLMMFTYGYSYEFADEQGLYLALALATAASMITKPAPFGAWATQFSATPRPGRKRT